MGAAAVEARSLYRFYRAGEEETLALQGVSLSVGAGEVVAVTGPSGSGKSTLLACLAGLDEPDGGSVHLGGVRISHRGETERARLRGTRVGLLFQGANLLAHLSVEQNLLLVQRLAGRRGDGGGSRAVALLADLGLSSRRHALPAQLSGGEAARAGLAVALVNEPVVLLADEPTGEVDSTTESAVLGLLRDVAEQGTAVIVVTHSPAVAAAADRSVGLLDGRLHTDSRAAVTA